MKTKILLVLLHLLLFTQAGLGCDMCACGVGSNYSGIMPNFSKNLVGIRYQQQSSDYLNSTVNFNGTSAIEQDNYQRADLYFRYYAKPRIQLLAFIPYQIHQRIESLRTSTIKGIGDINLLSYYTFINTGDSLTKTHKHTWYAGGGVKLPTGKYQQRDETKAMLPALFQIGTGAYSFALQNLYTYRYKSLGLSTNLQFRYNLKNELGFELGNQFTGTASLFYWKKYSKVSFLPSIGYLFDTIESNKNFDIPNPTTGGYAHLISMGLDSYFERFVLQIMAYGVVQQNLSVAMPQNRWKLTVGLAYYLDKKKD